MITAAARRILFETDARLLARFLGTFVIGGAINLLMHRRRLARGESFPPFLFISLTDRCNLSCKGCWVSSNGKPRDLDPAAADSVIKAAKARGSRFFGLLGGEPLMYGPLFDLIASHRDCYFQVFTNGTMMNADHAREMRRLGNVTPLISIEGLETESDERRGGEGVFAGAMEALDACRRNRLITGVATSVCRSNFDEVAGTAFISEMASRGAHYLWYYIYRPVGPKASPELALEAAQIDRLRRFLVDARCDAPLFIVDAYWDHHGRPLCPAAVGMSHHISPAGDVEPCPPIQFACESVLNGADIGELFNRSDFLKSFRKMAAGATAGCILMEDPQALYDFLITSGARDSSGRETALEELSRMLPTPGHGTAGEGVPEKSWFYRFAKKHWFFGLGAYG